MSTVKAVSFSRDAVRKRNARFAAMTPAQQRVTIAKDVLDWLEIGKITARPGTYMRFDVMAPAEVEDDYAWRRTTEAQDVLVQPGQSCTACALGSIFACTVGRADNIKVRDFQYAGQDDQHAYLAPYFSQRQLWLIESAFERSVFGCWDNNEYEDVAMPAVTFGERHVVRGWYDDPDTVSERPDGEIFEYPTVADASRGRMEAIMKNIIANGGEFKP